MPRPPVDEISPYGCRQIHGNLREDFSSLACADVCVRLMKTSMTKICISVAEQCGWLVDMVQNVHLVCMGPGALTLIRWYDLKAPMGKANSVWQSCLQRLGYVVFWVRSRRPGLSSFNQGSRPSSETSRRLPCFFIHPVSRSCCLLFHHSTHPIASQAFTIRILTSIT